MFHALSKQWQVFWRSTPGRRFQSVYECRSKSRGTKGLKKSKWLIGLGAVLAVAGLALMLLPGPGTLVLAGGLLLIARESPRVARLLDVADKKRHELTRRMLSKYRQWRRAGGPER